ncbi:MAG: methionine gamma-lyase family protein [Clostridiales bacterium]|jgi:cystathionine beta-lyase family protein involved in aluminum resistance|nr:methionine gamma-lyase family protein [Clostridiales bacterium]
MADLNYKFLKEKFNIKDRILELSDRVIRDINKITESFEKIREYNHSKVLYAMQKNKLSSSHFNYTSGYGYDDDGRDIIEKIYADIFKTEDALVRQQISSGTHAIILALKSNLNYGDELLFITGEPYLTLKKIICDKNNKKSFINNNILYKQIDLLDNNFDFENIKKNISDKTKVILIQRSRGYEYRDSICIQKIKKVIEFIKNISKDIIIIVDNCYGEFVEYEEPSEVGADLTCGSLTKNIGGGLAKTGGYIAGKKNLISNAAIELNAIGKNIGTSLGVNQNFLQGLFLSPQIVFNAIKNSIFISRFFEILNYKVEPRYDDPRTDITQIIELNSKEEVVKFCKSVQMSSPVDNFVTPEASVLPGYDCEIIMASGSFIQGSSIEYSADALIKEPYIILTQGGLNFSFTEILITINNFITFSE